MSRALCFCSANKNDDERGIETLFGNSNRRIIITNVAVKDIIFNICYSPVSDRYHLEVVCVPSTGEHCIKRVFNCGI